ncbi:purine catabolism regulator [Spinactinospora alkalitolerans]|uniref:Purine catabolism regulator n=1 Tax=Spinactinospora alkalitolerans TaxID=687207 RepID=A0A852TVJ0_9ACTN|nr:PucR family transcriptional regulator ligand-binding domain-containing protein [Spinactinospora alkalitolerans]NYE46104.1 purine catabolism regulator [Spinactinospora alkalitolerans]
MARGLTVADALSLSSLSGAEVVAGAAGLDRVIQRLNVMEVPDILPWVKPDELLLTTGYPLRNTPQDMVRLVRDLAERGLAAVAVKLGRYVDELPGEMLRAADELRLPILLLGDEVAFDDVLNQLLTDILNRQAATLARSEEVHRVLVNVILAGGGLAAITNELPALLDGGVMVTTPDGRVLARSGVSEEVLRDPHHFDLTSGRFHMERFKHGVRALDDDDPRVVQVPILAGNLDHGRIVLISHERPIDHTDVHVLERAAATAALVITKDLAVAAVEGKYQGDFLRDLLAGRAGDPEHAVRHCATLGWDIDRPLVVVVAEMDPEPASPVPAAGDLRPVHERFASAWTMVVRERDPKAAIAGYSQEVVVVMGAGSSGSDHARTVRSMVAQVSGDGGGGRRPFATGVSRVAASPEEIPTAYEQAKQAARVGRQMHGSGAVADFDDLGVFRLISLVPDSAELRAFMTETLGDLAERGDAETEDLRTTLEVLLDNNLNVAETARLLHFHYNTLRYRIGKLERMLGPFTTDPHLRLNLMVALRVIRMRGLRP